MNAPLIQQLNLRFRDVSPQVLIASLCVLGLECEALRQAGGYGPKGNWWLYRDDAGGKRTPWSTYVKQIAGISNRTARHYVLAAAAVSVRLESANRTELLELMRARPSSLTADERKVLIDGIAGALDETDTLTALCAAGLALEAKRNADPSPAGEDVMDIPEKPLPATDGTIELMAVELGIDPARARRIALEVLDLLGDGSLYGKRKKHGKKGRK